MRCLWAVCAGWAVASVVFALGFLWAYLGACIAVGPFYAFLHGLHSALGIRGDQSALEYMVSNEAADLATRVAAAFVYTTLPAACIVAAAVASRLCRVVGSKARLATAASVALGPVVLEAFVFPGLSGVLFSFLVCAVVGLSGAMCASVLLARRWRQA